MCKGNPSQYKLARKINSLSRETYKSEHLVLKLMLLGRVRSGVCEGAAVNKGLRGVTKRLATRYVV
jgi:hypothetical protein